MDRLTPEQRLQIVEIFYQNNGSIRQTFRALRPIYGVHNRPSERLIRITMDRFRSTFTLNDNVHPMRRRTVRTAEAVAAVQKSIEQDPNQSLRRRSQQLGLCPSTLWKILRNDIKISKSVKIQLVQELKPNDHRMRRQFAEWAKAQIDVDIEFPFKILFSDEANFWLNGKLLFGALYQLAESLVHMSSRTMMARMLLPVANGIGT
ncbi:uncharacterized protein LOC111601262 [Drosophila hydei]|uniref:Uncharacterized protein LOC111601262 n=1 Tax=Drosophila hydei TaxID=7224 RepID=A0A6J1LYR3_DROHY|nr:uncharacterized protein LOC111601262 [Drosophila hydei]